MYMGVIPVPLEFPFPLEGAPHVYGGDPSVAQTKPIFFIVLPMYMGVILRRSGMCSRTHCAPHVYGGDPNLYHILPLQFQCSPCIWG